MKKVAFLLIIFLNACQVLTIPVVKKIDNIQTSTSHIGNTGGNQPTGSNKVGDTVINLPIESGKIGNTGGNQPTESGKIGNTGGNQPTESGKLFPAQLKSILEQEEQFLKAIQLPDMLSETQARLIESGQQVTPAVMDKLKIKLQDLIQLQEKRHAIVQVQGLLGLPSKILAPSRLTIPEGLVLSQAILAPSRQPISTVISFDTSTGDGFNLKQLQSESILDGFIVEAFNPAGDVLEKTMTGTDGSFSFQRIPSGMRILIQATHPQIESFQLMAYLDIPPQSQAATFSPQLTPQSTALVRLIRSATRQGLLPVDRLRLHQVQAQVMDELEALIGWEKASLNQVVLKALSRPTPALIEWLENTRKGRVEALLTAAIALRKRVAKQPDLANLSPAILTSPVQLKIEKNIQAIVPLEEQQSGLKIELQIPRQAHFEVGDVISLSANLKNSTEQLIQHIGFYANEQLIATLPWDTEHLQLKQGELQIDWNTSSYQSGNIYIRVIARNQAGQEIASSRRQLMMLREKKG